MVLLCGSTGELGGRVARELLEAGAPLRVLLREGADAGEAASLGAEVVRGDLRDPSSLDAAVRGTETVVTTVTAMARALAGERVNLPAVDGAGTLALVAAAERAGAQRFVFTSYAGLSDEAAARHPIAAAKRAVERRLAESPMRTVIVRPDQFQEIWLSPTTQFDWPRGRVIVFGRGETRSAPVATGDAAAAIARLTLAADPPPVVEFGGPEAVTRHEAVRVFEHATGRSFRVRHVPRLALRAGMRAMRARKPEVASVMGLALFADLNEARWTDVPLRTLGIEPRGVSAYADEVTAG
jgi:uncharacterized protein YbjT (DUF2867 family)